MHEAQQPRNLLDCDPAQPTAFFPSLFFAGSPTSTLASRSTTELEKHPSYEVAGPSIVTKSRTRSSLAKRNGSHDNPFVKQRSAARILHHTTTRNVGTTEADGRADGRGCARRP